MRQWQEPTAVDVPDALRSAVGGHRHDQRTSDAQGPLHTRRCTALSFVSPLFARLAERPARYRPRR